MKTGVGFLLGNRVFSVDVPEYAEPPEFVSTIGTSAGSPLSLQCAPSERTDLASFGWSEQQAVSTREGMTVYGSHSDSLVAMPTWTAGRYVLWMQLRAATADDLANGLDLYVRGIAPSIDELGIPRVRLGPSLSPGNPWANQINREHVIFPIPTESRVISLRDDGALGSDSVTLDGGYVLVSVTTKAGVSILCDGPANRRDALLSEAREIATSFEQVA